MIIKNKNSLTSQLGYMFIVFIPQLYSTSLTQTNLETLTRPLTFNHAGLELYFAEQFNSPLYTEHILPAHFGHLAHFLDYGSTLAEPYDFTLTILDIFHTRMKDTLWVNALSFSLLLEQLPRYLQNMCAVSEQETLKESIREILYRRLLNRFTQLSQNPMDGINSFDTLLHTLDEVVDPTSLEISELVMHATKKRPIRDLQELVTRFIESALEKILWNPKTHHDSWDSVCILAEQIQHLYDCGIIHSLKIVNHLYWTLLYRYGYFLRSAQDMLNQETFEYIKMDIAQNYHEWLTLPESDELLTPKLEYLKYILWECITHRELNQTDIYAMP